MSEDRDLRIVNLLGEDAPPPSDPVFRLKVLERREHRQFQRRSFIMLAGALVIILVSTIAIRIGGQSLETTGALAFGTALASGFLAFRGRLLRILKRFSI